MTKRKLRKKADINPPQSPHDGIHTCSKGCKKPGCNRTLRDTIVEQNQQIEALKRDVLNHSSEARMLYEFMSRFDWIIYAHNCKGHSSETSVKLDSLRADYRKWMHPDEEQGL